MATPVGGSTAWETYGERQRLDFRLQQGFALGRGVMIWHVGLQNALGTKNFYANLWEPNSNPGTVSQQDQMPRFSRWRHEVHVLARPQHSSNPINLPIETISSIHSPRIGTYKYHFEPTLPYHLCQPYGPPVNKVIDHDESLSKRISQGLFFYSVRPQQRAKFVQSLFVLCVASLAVCQAGAQATSFPGKTSVGATSPTVLVNVAIQHAGPLSGIRVVAQGASNLEFVSAASGSCTVGCLVPCGPDVHGRGAIYPDVSWRSQWRGRAARPEWLRPGHAILSGDGAGGIGRLVPGRMSTVAGRGTWLYSGDGAPAIDSSIYLPSGIAVDSAGNLYIADSGNNRIRKVTASTGLMSTVAGNGILGGTGDGGPAVQASLSGPTSVALDGAGNIYFCDSANQAVRRISAQTGGRRHGGGHDREPRLYRRPRARRRRHSQ